MENFIKKSKLVGSAFEVDQTDPSNVRRLTKIYFVARFESEILKMDLNSEENRKKVDGVRKYCLDFYFELCNQIKMRADHQDPLLSQLERLSPTVAVSGKIKSIVPIYEKFSQALKLDIEQLNTEWKEINSNKKLFEDFNKLPKPKPKKSKHMKENIPSDSDEKAMSPMTIKGLGKSLFYPTSFY